MDLSSTLRLTASIIQIAHFSSKLLCETAGIYTSADRETIEKWHKEKADVHLREELLHKLCFDEIEDRHERAAEAHKTTFE
jgi:hypothetical protein